jgi:1-deoxy-D-xylulose-5-phosphate reductoisomerase
VNTADEVAVDLFLKEEISFLEIAELIEFAMDHFASQEAFTLDGVIKLDARIREELGEKFLNR